MCSVLHAECCGVKNVTEKWEFCEYFVGAEIVADCGQLAKEFQINSVQLKYAKYVRVKGFPLNSES